MFVPDESNGEPVNPSAGYGDMLSDAGIPVLSETERIALETESGIHHDAIKARGYTTMLDKRKLPEYGFTAYARNVPSLLIPLHDVEGETVYQLRLHKTEPNEDGKEIRYLNPKGARLVVDVNPIARDAVMNAENPLWITEGAKKADSAISRGMACVSLSGVDCWQQNGTALPDWYKIPMKKREVNLVFDNDEKPTAKRNTYFAMRKFGAFLKTRGAVVRFVFLPTAEQGGKVGLDDYFVSGGTVKGLDELTLSELPPLQAGIEITNRQLRDITDEALQALIEKNEPPRLFVQGGRLVRVQSDETGAKIVALDKDSMRGELTRAADWISTGEKKGAVSVSPPLPVACDLLTLPEFPDLPVLEGIVSAPTFTPSGKLHSERGYCAETRLYFDASEGFILPSLDTTPQGVERALQVILKELMGDFPFLDNASRAHAVAYLLTPFVRAMIAGYTPMYLFDAPTSSTGKTLLCETLAKVFFPTVGISSPPTDEQEWSKTLLSLLMQGRSHIIFDNAERLKSPALFKALTVERMDDRVLGVSENAKPKVLATWAATSNNLRMTNELITRTVYIRLDARCENPDERKVFRHSDLQGWAKGHRVELIAAACTLVQAWIEKGRPKPTSEHSMPRYAQWAEVIGGILESVGIKDFLANRSVMKQRADDDSAAWYGFVEEWAELFKEQEVTSAELLPIAKEHHADKIGEGTEQSQKTKLGIMLRKHLDRIFGDYRIADAGKVMEGKNRKASKFVLVRDTDDSDGETEAEPSEPSEPSPLRRESITAKVLNEKSAESNNTAGKEVPKVPKAPRIAAEGSSLSPLCLPVYSSVKETAETFGRIRKEGHDGKREAHEDAGSEQANLQRDYTGLVGEAVFRPALEAAGIEHHAAPFVSNKAESTGDITIGDFALNIKTGMPTSRSFNLNVEQYKNCTEIDFYLPLRMTSEDTILVYAPVPYCIVETWKKVVPDNPSRAFYAKDWSELEPLADLSAIEPICRRIMEEAIQ